MVVAFQVCRHGGSRYACGKIRASAASGDNWGNEIIAGLGQEPPSRLVHVDFDHHIFRLGRGVLAVKLRRQGTQVAQVLALEPALQHLDGDAPAQRSSTFRGYDPSLT